VECRWWDRTEIILMETSSSDCSVNFECRRSLGMFFFPLLYNINNIIIISLVTEQWNSKQ
jgi:hypothetical protein